MERVTRVADVVLVLGVRLVYVVCWSVMLDVVLCDGYGILRAVCEMVIVLVAWIEGDFCASCQ